MREAAKLLAMVESPALPLAERAAAAEELALLGDPRARAVDHVAIPAGPFLFRGSAVDGDGSSVNGSVSVTLSAYSIDRYPVTVAAYAAFIEAGGYRARRF